jgi:hypothetical protein
MSECRRCGAEISPADVQKGRALQRGEFWYCPTCVADARAAKAGVPATAGAPASSRGSAVAAVKQAPASGAHRAPASGVLKAPPPSGRNPGLAAQRSPASGAVPGLKSAPPPSSTKMKPVPAPASRKVAVPPPEEPLLEEDAAEEDPKPSGRHAARGASSGRLAKAPGGPASGKMRKPAPEPEEEDGPGSLRKKIGFKDGSAGVKPMSKQTLMMWAVVGGIFFAAAGGLFFTVIVKRGRENSAYKANAELCKEYSGELERLLREKPRDFEAIDAAFAKFKEVAVKDKKYSLNVEDFEKVITRRKEHHKLKKQAQEELAGIAGNLSTVEGTDEGLRKAKKSIAFVRSVEWVLDEKKEHEDRMLGVLKAAKTAAETAKAAAPPNWVLAAGAYDITATISGSLPPEVFPAQDAQSLQKDIDEAVEKRYDDEEYLKKFTWEDLTAITVDWKNDDYLTVARGADGISIENKSDKEGLFWLNAIKGWQDYTIKLDFTCNAEAFVLSQRRGADKEASPAINHDVRLLIGGGAMNANERTTLNFMVFGGKNRVGREKWGRAQRCQSTGSRAGGFLFRIPVGAKVTLHKIEVQVYQEEDPNAAPVKK